MNYMIHYLILLVWYEIVIRRHSIVQNQLVMVTVMAMDMAMVMGEVSKI